MSLITDFTTQVLHYLTRKMRQAYSAHMRKVCLVLKEGGVVCAKLLFGITANLSFHQHHVAIRTSTDVLRHLRVRVIYPILN